MSPQEDASPECLRAVEFKSKRRKTWDYIELLFGYALILAVIWTQRPLQRWLYFGAIAWFALSILISFPGWKAMGCSIAGFWHSLWVVGVAVLMATSAWLLASNFHTLHHPALDPYSLLGSSGLRLQSEAARKLQANPNEKLQMTTRPARKERRAGQELQPAKTEKGVLLMISLSQWKKRCRATATEAEMLR